MKNIYYYLIGVGSLGLKQQGFFTYSHNSPLAAGQIVGVNLKHIRNLGVVISTTKKPAFKVSPVLNTFEATIPPSNLELLRWAISYYPNECGAVIRLFLPPNLLKNSASSTAIPTLIEEKATPKLTKEQLSAINEIDKEKKISILHGKTGTGKTRVYIELAKKQLASGKSVLVLSPEISLSEQILGALEKSFKNCISYHSLHTIKQRRETWLALSSSNVPRVIVGPRSALFLPINNLGLIILDEAHDAAYKQQQSPYYSTLQLASKLAQITKIPLVYGSATPNTADYYAAEAKQFPIITMSERPIASTTEHQTTVEVVNSRDKTQFIKNRQVSDKAIARIKKSLKNGKQCLLLLNRRGTAQLLQCETCAWQYRCPTCDHTLVYHRDKHKAICHYCGKENPMVNLCPEDSGSVRQFNIGTKFIEEICKSLFPGESVQRIDRDSVERETIKDVMAALARGESKILVGTQLLAKGLDLPLLDTVVVLDATPQSSDYLGDERYYQLLHQVIGRGMRGHQNTTVIIQTPDPEDQIIAWASEDNWHDFYEHELKERKLYNYPPFSQIATIRYSRKNSTTAEKICQKLSDEIVNKDLKVDVLGPLPVRSKKIGVSDWVIILKSKKRSELVEASKYAPKDSVIDLEPISTQ